MRPGRPASDPERMAANTATPADPRPTPRSGRPDNPVRISRIGNDRLELHIRDPSGYAELLALVERLERLIDVGYDAIDVIFEGMPPDRRHHDQNRREEHRRA